MILYLQVVYVWVSSITMSIYWLVVIKAKYVIHTCISSSVWALSTIDFELVLISKHNGFISKIINFIYYQQMLKIPGFHSLNSHSNTDKIPSGLLFFL